MDPNLHMYLQQVLVVKLLQLCAGLLTALSITNSEP